MTDQNQIFLNKFISLYQELMAHDGYGDISVKIRLVKRGKKEVCLECGREYRYRIDMPDNIKKLKKYKVVEARSSNKKYNGHDRRSNADRRDNARSRRNKDVPRDFKLERRCLPDRRAGQRGRRYDD